MSPRSTILPLYFWNCGSNSTFFELTDVHPCCKMDFLFVSLCFEKNLLLTLDFVQLPGWNRFELFSIPCPLLLSPPEFSSLEASEDMCEPSCNESLNYALCLRCDLHDPSVDMVPLVFSWTREPPRCMHALVLESCRIHHSSLQVTETRSVSLFLSCMALPPPLELPKLPLRFCWFLCIHHPPDE